MAHSYRRVAVRTACIGGALAFLLGACGEPSEQTEQQGSVTPEQEQSTTAMEAGGDAETTEQQQ